MINIVIVIEFENLQKAFLKSRNILDQDGGTPKFFIKAIVELEDFVQQVLFFGLITCLKLITSSPFESFGMTKKLSKSCQKSMPKYII